MIYCSRELEKCCCGNLLAGGVIAALGLAIVCIVSQWLRRGDCIAMINVSVRVILQPVWDNRRLVNHLAAAKPVVMTALFAFH